MCSGVTHGAWTTVTQASSMTDIEPLKVNRAAPQKNLLALRGPEACRRLRPMGGPPLLLEARRA